MYVHPPPHATTYHHHWPPPHSASCSSVSAGFICMYLHLHMQLRTTTTDHHHTVQVAQVSVQVLYVCTSTSTCNYVPPPLTTTDHHHTVQVARVQVQYLRQWLDEKAPPAQVAEDDTTTCASGLSALVAEWKSTTSASCNWWQPPPVQVEYLHQLKEGKHHKHKVQRSGCKVQRSGHKVQRSGPASALVGTGCSNNMQLQPPPPCTDHADMTNTARCSNHCNLREG